MSDLVGRAVEAAAIERFRRATTTPWEQAFPAWQEQYREMVRPAVLVALGVVADALIRSVPGVGDGSSRGREMDAVIGFVEEFHGRLRETPK